MAVVIVGVLIFCGAIALFGKFVMNPLIGPLMRRDATQLRSGYRGATPVFVVKTSAYPGADVMDRIFSDGRDLDA